MAVEECRELRPTRQAERIIPPLLKPAGGGSYTSFC